MGLKLIRSEASREGFLKKKKKTQMIQSSFLLFEEQYLLTESSLTFAE